MMFKHDAHLCKGKMSFYQNHTNQTLTPPEKDVATKDVGCWFSRMKYRLTAACYNLSSCISRAQGMVRTATFVRFIWGIKGCIYQASSQSYHQYNKQLFLCVCYCPVCHHQEEERKMMCNMSCCFASRWCIT